MYYCIMILAAGATLHFVYESIIAPSLRLELRLALIRLGNEVRLLEDPSSAAADERSDVVERQLCELQDSIDSLACMLFKFDLVTIYAISEEIDRDAGLKRRVEARARILDDCALPEVLVLRESTDSHCYEGACCEQWANAALVSCAGVTLCRLSHRLWQDQRIRYTVPAPDLERFILDDGRRPSDELRPGAGFPVTGQHRPCVLSSPAAHTAPTGRDDCPAARWLLDAIA